VQTRYGQEGTVDRRKTKVGNLATTGRLATQAGRRHSTHWEC
jgi:hypothetical protein